MICKIDHNDTECIPKALCRVCNPTLNTRVQPKAAPEPDTAAVQEHAERMDKRKARKLRAEAKRLRAEIALIAGRNPQATKKLETTLDAINRELYLVT